MVQYRGRLESKNLPNIHRLRLFSYGRITPASSGAYVSRQSLFGHPNLCVEARLDPMMRAEQRSFYFYVPNLSQLSRPYDFCDFFVVWGRFYLLDLELAVVLKIEIFFRSVGLNMLR